MGSVIQVKECLECGERYLLHIARKVCDECRAAKVVDKKPVLSKVCKGCGTEFTTVKLNKKYCTKACRKTYEHINYMRKKYELR
jgi:hypothetical protein